MGGFGCPLSISGKEVNLNVDTDGQGEKGVEKSKLFRGRHKCITPLVQQIMICKVLSVYIYTCTEKTFSISAGRKKK